RPVMVPAQAEPGSGPPREEVSPSRRRDLLGTGILLAASTATTGATSRAAQISRAIAASTPDPLSVAQLHQGIQRLTRIYSTTPHADLLGPVEQAWDDAEARLETRVTGTDRRDLELLAGQYAFYRGRLAFDMGDDDGALTFFVLAAQHAQAAGNPLLAGSVAAMRSAVAFFAREFETAADIAAQAQPQAHPYIVPLLACAQARAYAITSREDEALTALRTMNDHVWTGNRLPGPSPIDEESSEAFNAVVLGYLGKGDEAEPHARASLAMLSGTGRYVSTAGTTPWSHMASGIRVSAVGAGGRAGRGVLGIWATAVPCSGDQAAGGRRTSTPAMRVATAGGTGGASASVSAIQRATASASSPSDSASWASRVLAAEWSVGPLASGAAVRSSLSVPAVPVCGGPSPVCAGLSCESAEAGRRRRDGSTTAPHTERAGGIRRINANRAIRFCQARAFRRPLPPMTMIRYDAGNGTESWPTWVRVRCPLICTDAPVRVYPLSRYAVRVSVGAAHRASVRTCINQDISSQKRPGYVSEITEEKGSLWSCWHPLRAACRPCQMSLSGKADRQGYRMPVRRASRPASGERHGKGPRRVSAARIYTLNSTRWVFKSRSAWVGVKGAVTCAGAIFRTRPSLWVVRWAIRWGIRWADRQDAGQFH
ncbi:hypothetical protein BMG523Draft_04333, partial [Frankia sp. BMG5.23]